MNTGGKFRAYNGPNLTEEYLKENLLPKTSYANMYAGVSTTDFVCCSHVFSPYRTHKKGLKNPFSYNMVLEPLLTRSFYYVINTCLYENKEFLFSRGKVGLYHFPAYYNAVCKDQKHEPYLNYSKHHLKLGGIQLKPYFSVDIKRQLGLYKNPIHIRGSKQFQKDVAHIINNQGDISNKETFTVKEVAQELYPLFEYLPFELIQDSINEFFKTYLRLSLKRIPINISYIDKKSAKQKGERKYIFRIVNYNKVEEAIRWYYKGGVERIAYESTRNKRFRKFKFRKMKYILMMNEYKNLISNCSSEQLLTFKEKMYTKYRYFKKTQEELNRVYNITIKDSPAGNLLSIINSDKQFNDQLRSDLNIETFNEDIYSDEYIDNLI